MLRIGQTTNDGTNKKCLMSNGFSISVSILVCLSISMSYCLAVLSSSALKFLIGYPESITDVNRSL